MIRAVTGYKERDEEKRREEKNRTEVAGVTGWRGFLFYIEVNNVMTAH